MRLRSRAVDAQRTAHFLVQMLFCLFAEDIGLLPNRLFTRILQFSARSPESFAMQVEALFLAMRDGGVVALEDVPHFNGGLFNEIGVEPLTAEELKTLAEAATLDWGSVEPAIFGTLFERSLDPGKRAQLEAHYTGRADIERVVDPVLMAPLRRRWDEVRERGDQLRATWQAATNASTATRRRAEFASLLLGFQQELSQVRVLDPACGSGNFLCVALAKLLDLEKEVSRYAASNGLSAMFAQVHPRQVMGMEVNEYAAELAQVVIWIGYLQWLSDNGLLGVRQGSILENLGTIRLQDALLGVRQGSILENLGTIRLQDALLDRSEPDHPKEAEWPAADEAWA